MLNPLSQGLCQRLCQRLGKILRSRTVLVLSVLASVVVPAVTLPRLPAVSPWPVLAGLAPWIVGKYVLCPLRWRTLTPAGLSRRWHLRAYAESELLGLLTPGHVGADLWRLKRLTGAGLRSGDAVVSVGTDRLVGALGLVAFVGFAGFDLPVRMLLAAAVVAGVAVTAAVVLLRRRPDLLPARRLPPPRAFLVALGYSMGYQLSIAALLVGVIGATGHTLSPWAVLAAFGGSQAAAAVPGPNGASPRDGALVVGLVAAGIPWAAAVAAVALKASLAWVPALLIGGTSLLRHRRALAAA